MAVTSEPLLKQRGGGKLGKGNKKEKPTISLEEVRKHNKETDCWIVIKEKVYNVTKWAPYHPGGPFPILKMAGKDCTDLFAAFHDTIYYEKLPAFHVANLETKEHSDFVKEHRKLRQTLIDEGYYEPSYAWFIMKMVVLICQFTFALSLVLYVKDNFYVHMFSAVMLGLYWQQLSFLEHDLLHSGMSHKRKIDTFVGLLFGSTIGVSGSWWKHTHNIHHVVTNSIEADPDIQHLPVFCVSNEYFSGVFSTHHKRVLIFDKIAKWIISYQHILFYPILCLARFNLFAQSWIFMAKTQDKILFKWGEVFGLVFYWVWYLYFLTYLPDTTTRVCYFFVSQLCVGILHLQIVISHFAMPSYHGITYNDDSDEMFHTATSTSMDVDCPKWLDWFHGGLQFQVVHHIFPKLPRHNLREVRDKYVIPLCKKYGLKYHLYGFYECNEKVLTNLKQTALEARKYPDSKLNRGPLNMLWEAFNAQG